MEILKSCIKISQVYNFDLTVTLENYLSFSSETLFVISLKWIGMTTKTIGVPNMKLRELLAKVSSISLTNNYQALETEIKLWYL